MPAGQATQDEAPEPLYKPTPQVEHVAAAALLNLPPAHEEQLEAPTPLYVPPTQTSQATWPVAGWYIPAGQLLQELDAFDGCTCPAAHWVQLPAPVAMLYLPISQAVQDEAPAPLYEPTPHDEHEAAPSSDHSPAEHTEQDAEAADDHRPPEQVEQRRIVVAPVPAPYVPALQLWQSPSLS